MLFSVSVGAKHDELHLVYENDDNFMALPTMAVLPAQRVMMTPEALQSHPLLADADLTRVRESSISYPWYKMHIRPYSIFF